MFIYLLIYIFKSLTKCPYSESCKNVDVDAYESDGETVLSTRVVIYRKKKHTDLYFTLYQSYLA